MPSSFSYVVYKTYSIYIYIYIYIWGRDSVVGIETRGWKVLGGVILRTRPDCPGVHPVSYTMGTGSLAPDVKRPGRGVDHPPQSSAEVKEKKE